MKGIFVYPWNIEVPSGARSVLECYASAFFINGITLDLCALATSKKTPYPPYKELSGFNTIFEPINLFVYTDETVNEAHTRVASSKLSELTIDYNALFWASTIVKSGNYDFVGVHYTMCYQIVNWLPNEIPTILFTHDLDSEVANHKKNPNCKNDSNLIKEEVSRIRSFDFATVFGNHDLDILKVESSDLDLVVAPFCPQCRYKRIERENVTNLLFIGNDLPFKRTALDWFFEKVTPILLEKKLNIKIQIVGAISDYATNMFFDKYVNLEIHDVVERIEPILEKADLLIAPYLYGGGIKNNIIEAIASGIPVVTTSFGVLNTNLQHRKELWIADDPVSFAEAIFEASDKETLTKISTAAINWASKELDPQVVLAPLIQKTKALVDNRKNEISNLVKLKNSSWQERLNLQLPRIVKSLRKRGFFNIAVYGAGEQSKLMLQYLKNETNIRVSAVIVSDKNPYINELEKVRVVSITDVVSPEFDAIVAASASYEEDMMKTAKRYLSSIPFCTIWTDSPNKLTFTMQQE